MSGETNRLLAMSKELAAQPAEREVDALLATGEQVTSALLSVTLNGLGVPACSLLGHQVRILTDGAFNKARIRSIESGKLTQVLSEGKVAVIPGFQGIDVDGNITTLGRGGSDTTAVALAAATRADVCEIYTDVEGVFTADPGVCKSARKIERIGYEEMLELASLGAKVLQIRSVEIAMKYAVPVHVRSSFSDKPGTWVVPESDLEAVLVTGVTYDKNESKVTVRSVPDEPGAGAALFEPMAEANISVDMIIQNVSIQGTTDLTFTVPKSDLDKAKAIAEKVVKEIGAKEVVVDDNVVKVSIVGAGMRTHAGIAAKTFRLLADEGINILAISTSEIKVSVLIQAKYAELAVRTLHTGFGLGNSEQPRA